MYKIIIKFDIPNYKLALTKPKYLRISADIAIIPYVWHSAIIFSVFSHSSSQHIVDAVIVELIGAGFLTFFVIWIILIFLYVSF